MKSTFIVLFIFLIFGCITDAMVDLPEFNKPIKFRNNQNSLAQSTTKQGNSQRITKTKTQSPASSSNPNQSQKQLQVLSSKKTNTPNHSSTQNSKKNSSEQIYNYKPKYLKK